MGIATIMVWTMSRMSSYNLLPLANWWAVYRGRFFVWRGHPERVKHQSLDLLRLHWVETFIDFRLAVCRMLVKSKVTVGRTLVQCLERLSNASNRRNPQTLL